MDALTAALDSLALKLGIGAGSKSLVSILLVLALPIGIVALGVALFVRKKRKKKPAAPVRRDVREVKPAKTALILLILFSALFGALLLSLAGLFAYDRLKERPISIAAGTRKTESYVLAQALKTVTERHYPHIKITILEIEDVTEPLEKGLIQLATAKSDAPAGPSARSVAALSAKSVLLARGDADEKVVYALTQVLMQRGQELADAIPVANAALRPLMAKVQKPNSETPLHPGAVAFYDGDKTPFVLRYAVIIALTFAGLVMSGLWAWELRRWSLRKRQAEKDRQERRFAGLTPSSGPAEGGPWTFSRLLQESAGEASQPPKMVSAVSGPHAAGGPG
ncbi:MAG: TAXI family TRAP transporter solute-binding subunit [Blastocatellia bacterium]